MRKQWLYPLLIIFLLLLLACNQQAEIKAGLGEEFSLSAGQSAAITGENLRIRFIEITEDSRCPQGVTCIWAGRVSCLIEITKTDSSAEPERLVLTQMGLTSPPATQAFNGYELAFDVEPYPVAGQTIPEEDYRLTLTVTR